MTNYSKSLDDIMRSPTTEEVNESVERLSVDIHPYGFKKKVNNDIDKR